MRGVRVGSIVLLAMVALLVLGGGAAPAATQNVAYVVMYSDSGDYIGGGTQREFDPGNASITVSGTPSYLTVGVDGGTAGDYYDMDFAASPGDLLTSGGVYTNAQRAPFRDAGHPGIDIYGSGRGCNTDTGLFEVKDIATDSTGAVSRLWIVYEQHCEGGRPALWGEVKLNEPAEVDAATPFPGIVRWPATDVGAPNTVVPVTFVAASNVTISGVSIAGTNASDFTIRTNECSGVALVANDGCDVWLRFVASAPGMRQATLHVTDSAGSAYDITLQGFAYGGTTSVTMTSDAGDYIGQGQTWSYSLAKGDQIGLGGGRSYAGFGINGANGDWWSGDFVPGSGDILAAGSTYSNATRYPFNGSGPGLDVSGNGRGCNTLTGSFTVNSATFATDGTLKTASISFVQHCEGATAALHGTFAFRAGDNTAPAPWMIATTPVPAPPPPAQSPPTIGSFSPTSGQAGSSVTITGTNFNGTTGVAFNGASATFTVAGSTQITAAVPANATTGQISVTTGAGTAVSANSFTVTPPPPPPGPTISSFSPGSGPPGTAVTITGTNFASGATVSFAGAPAVANVISTTQVQTAVPSGATTGPITVTTPGGTATSGTSFVVTGQAPSISSFSPSSGPPGTTVTINGANFGGVSSVTFNGAQAVYSVVSSTQIQAAVPSGATSGTIGVVSSSGSAQSGTNFAVTGTTQPPTPTITGFTPASGAAGTTVTITGTNLTNAGSVAFNGAAATYTVASATQIQATVPAGATSGKVTVTTPGGVAQSGSDFTVAAPAAAPPPPPPSPQPSGGGSGGGSSGIAPDLHVAVQPSTTTAPAQGGELDYVVKVTSANSGGSSDVRLDLTLPAGYTVTRVVADRGPGCTGTAPSLSCDVGWINPQTSTTVQVSGTVGQAGTQTLTATVTSMLEPELNPADNTVTLALSPSAPPAVPAPTVGVVRSTKTVAPAALRKAPSVLGARRPGATLRATAPTWTAPSTQLRYVWQRCTHTSCLGIPGQRGRTLRIRRSDVGYWIRVAETATVRGTRRIAYSAKAFISAR